MFTPRIEENEIMMVPLIIFLATAQANFIIVDFPTPGFPLVHKSQSMILRDFVDVAPVLVLRFAKQLFTCLSMGGLNGRVPSTEYRFDQTLRNLALGVGIM